jgi:glycosyltransferase involved in cell wall biosynthesis
MIEAMSVGTPIVALRHGAVPELVVPDRTGLICDDPAELPDALHAVSAIDPVACTAHVRASFSAELMARRYEQVYRRWAATGAPESAPADAGQLVGCGTIRRG